MIPSEISAALRHADRVEAEAQGYAENCDRLTRELSVIVEQRDRLLEQQRQLDADFAEIRRELSEARLALIPLQVDKAAAEKMAIETGRELAEAREALASERGRGDKLQSAQPWADVQRLTAELTRAGTERESLERLAETLKDRVEKAEALCYVPGVLKCAKCGCVLITTNLHADTGQFSANNDPQRCPNDCGPMWRRTEREAGNELCDRLDSMNDKLKAAESSLRVHAEAVGALRDALDGVMAVVAANNTKLGWNSISTPDEIVQACALLALPEGALASRLSAEHEAERAVVRAARKWLPTYNWAAGCDCEACVLAGKIDALASPSDKEDT
jgi:hypothetical protein